MLLGIRTRNHAEYRILYKASQLDIAFFETPAFYDQMENALREVPRTHNFTWSSFELLNMLMSLSVLLVMLYDLHPAAIPIIVLTAIPEGLFLGHFANRWWKLSNTWANARRMARYLALLLSGRQAIKEIRIFGLGTELLKRYRQHCLSYFEEERSLRVAKLKASSGLGVVSVFGTALIWTYTVMQAVLERITLGDVSLFFQASEQCRTRFNGLVSGIGRFYEEALFAENLLGFLALDPQSVEGTLMVRDTTKFTPVTRHSLTATGSPFIEFRNVTFRYPGSMRSVLDDVSLSISKGDRVAIVGENGAGKTTLIKLLARLYDPSAGEILLEGINVKDHDLMELQARISVLFQDFVRYDLSLRDNVGFGNPLQLGDTGGILRAIDLAGANGIVEKLPFGLETMLGKTFEDGVELSGGEWQKIGISRAFMREKADLIVLDEPTAAMDAVAEHELYKRVMVLTSGKTSIVISHRFSTVRKAEMIMVLKQGKLIETGSHDELISRGGHYAYMFELQASRYV